MKLPKEMEGAWWNVSMLGTQSYVIEAVVRDCAKVCEELGKDIVCPEECAVAILAHYRLEDKP